MTLKRFEGTRSLSIEDIPAYMDELRDLEALYFSLTHEADKKACLQRKALYEYTHWLDPPKDHSLVTDKKGRYLKIPYRLVAHLAKFSPDSMDEKEFIRVQLEEYNLVNSDQDWSNIESFVEYPIRWSSQMVEESKDEIELSEVERQALETLIEALKEIDFSSETIQQTIFETGNKYNIKARNFFPLLYQIFIGETSGPRIGSLLELMGRDNTIDQLKKHV